MNILICIVAVINVIAMWGFNCAVIAKAFRPDAALTSFVWAIVITLVSLLVSRLMFVVIKEQWSNR